MADNTDITKLNEDIETLDKKVNHVIRNLDVITENISEYLTNSVNMTSKFYDIFLKSEAEYVKFSMYNENNELVDVVIPNRAMDAITAAGSSNGVISILVTTPSGTFELGGPTAGFNITNLGIQGTLISGTNIKTINGTSILGSGNIDVQTPLVSGADIKTINNTSLLGSGNIAVQIPLVSGTNIKTINGTSILGSGNIDVQTPLVSGADIKTINNTSLLGSGNITISGNNLFDIKWSDHLLDDQSWLQSNGSWCSGSTYHNAYSHLVSDISGKAAQAESIGGYTVLFYRADDGHKICLADQETIVNNIYAVTGAAWYYVLDTTNARFKLPRTKFGFNGYRDNVGNYLEAGLPNITGTFHFDSDYPSDQSGAFKDTYMQSTGGFSRTSSMNASVLLDFNASNSSSIYGNAYTVQPPATQMYLYFYVGEFSQTAAEQTAGLNSELFSGKADRDFGNISAVGLSRGASWAMSSETYDDLVLGASGATYTAPATGWVIITRVLTSGYLGIAIVNSDDTDGICMQDNNPTNSAFNANVYIPVSKGQTFKVVYSGISTDVYSRFRFIYAQGEA